MDITPPIHKNQKSNAECCKDYKQKENSNDASFRDKKRISVNGYRAKRKENQSEVEKITQHEKEKCRFTKKQTQMLDKK